MMAEIPNSQIVRVISSVLIVTVLCPCIYGKVIYVDNDAPEGGSGTDGTDPYKYLQEALAAAVSGDEIRVAEGVYTPDLKPPAPPPPRRSVLSYSASAGDRTATFQLKNGVTIKGGYAGFDAPEPDIRDIELYETILSGDLNGDDIQTFGNNGENSYHVVTGSGTDETAVLDGFTITGGNARGSSHPQISGGGMYNDWGSPTLTNCTFRGNWGENGAGMYNHAGNPTLTQCTFEGNWGRNGGGIYNHFGGPVLTNCTFSENKVGGSVRSSGGAMANYGGNPKLIQCTFSGNWGNSQGGGIYSVDQSSLDIEECIITGNSTSGNGLGGGICCDSDSSVQITNSIITGNSATFGSGIYCHDSSPTIINSTLAGNLATGYGGGGIYCGNSSPTVVNTILWNNHPDEIYLKASSITVTHSNVYGGWPGVGNIDADPLFVDADGADNVIGTADDNLRLLRGSPCIDAGDNRSIPSSVVTDLGGDARILNGNVDMGAYEGGVAPPSHVYYVNVVNGDNSNSGLSLKAAFATIQKGVDTATDGDTVLVWPGIYREPINFSGKAITIQSAQDAAVLEAPDDFAVSFYTGEGPDSVLKNFVIRNSFMGIFIAGSSPAICNVTVTDNKSGMEAYAGAEPDITNSIFWNNSDGDLFQCQARYSCIERKAEGEGEGNISADPLFVDPDKGDYHIRSERGRYWPEHGVWVLDKVSSPCIDRGDPNDNYSDEPTPNGGCINMGAYGGTAYASMSEAGWLNGDINRDGTVNMIDLALLAENWLRRREVPTLNQPPEVNITAPADGAVLPYTASTYIEAEASDIDGFVVKVEFLVDGSKIGEDTDGSDGWTIYWSDHGAGEYELMVRATDDGGASRDSTSIDISLRPFSRSSRRYKINIEDLETNLEDVVKLRPVRFQWKTTGHEDIGLIAEEVAQVLGDLVMYDRQDRPEAVQYDKLALYLLAVVKAQQQRIAALEESETQNKSLTRRVEFLESLLHQHQSVFAAGKEIER